MNQKKTFFTKSDATRHTKDNWLKHCFNFHSTFPQNTYLKEQCI